MGVRKNTIQAHTKEINKLKFDKDTEAALFAFCDKNQDGFIQEDELQTAIMECGFVHLTPEKITKIFRKADANRDKNITLEEFRKRCTPTLRRNFAKLAS